MTHTSEAIPHIKIRPSKSWGHYRWKDLWAYRELLYFLVWRDLKVRYKQTALGGAWAILQPVLTMVVFSIFFGKLAKVPSDGNPYPIFVYTALLPWQLFAHAMTESSSSLVANQQLVTKVYFPRVIIPIATALSGLVDFAIAFLVLAGMMWFYGIAPSKAIIALPLFLILSITAAIAIGLWLSALNVKYRDVRYTLPFLIQLWFFATPIAYPSSMIPEPWHTFYGLNPMAGVIEGFRWAILGNTGDIHSMMAVAAITTVTLFAGGFLYFQRTERGFADII